MRTLFLALLFALVGLTGSGAWAQSVVGVWSTQLRSNIPDSGAAGVVVAGVIYLTFYPNGNFVEFYQLQNGQSQLSGRYLFNGNTVQYIADGFTSYPYAIQPPVPLHQVGTLPIAFAGNQMEFGGLIWNRNQ